MIRRWMSPVAASFVLHIAAAAAFVALVATVYSTRPSLSLPAGGIEGVDVALHHDEPAPAAPVPPPTSSPQDAPVEQVVQENDPAPTPEPAPIEIIDAFDAPPEPPAPVTQADEHPPLLEPVGVETRPTPEMEQLIHDAIALGERITAALPSALERAASGLRKFLGRAAAAAPAIPDPGSPSKQPAERPSLAPGGTPGVSHGPAPAFGNLAPRYPEAARRAGQEGTVLVHVTIETTGVVSACEVGVSSGYDALDAAAVDAVKSWMFKPAMTDGAPVRAEADVPVVFRLHP